MPNKLLGGASVTGSEQSSVVSQRFSGRPCQNMVPNPEASASLGCLLGMKILTTHPRPTDQNLRVDSRNLVLTKVLGDSDAHYNLRRTAVKKISTNQPHVVCGSGYSREMARNIIPSNPV